MADSASGGNIVVELTLDNQKYRVQVKDSANVLRELQAALNQTASATKALEANQDSLATKLHLAVMTAGQLRFAMMDLHDVFLRLPAAILESAGSLERLQAQMRGLSTELTESGRIKEASKDFDYLIATAQKTPFSLNSLHDAFVKLKSGGLDPTQGSLKALADGVAKFGGNDQTLQRAALAIQQMMGKGVVSMEELRRQLGEAVPMAMRDMAEGMGLSMNALTALIKTGTVQAADAVNKMLNIMQARSEGASAAMMATWTGMLSQLKTRFELAAKGIADAGFMDAMKGALHEIDSQLDSSAFKRFQLQFGETLTTAVEDLVAVVKKMIEFGDTIKTLAEAWLIYKASSSFVSPALKTIYNDVTALTGAYSTSMKAQVLAASTAKTLAMETTLAEAEKTETMKMQTASRLLLLESEMQANEAALAQEVANARKWQAAYAATLARGTGGVRSPETGVFVSRAVADAELVRLANLQSSYVSAAKVIQTEIDATTIANQQAAVALTGHANKVAELEKTAVRASVGLGVMASAGKAVSIAFNALGGVLGLINLAVTAGILLWDRYGHAAEEAAARADRAKKGISDPKDVAKTADAIKDLQESRDAAAKRLATAEGGYLTTLGDADKAKARAKLVAEIQKYDDQIAALKTEKSAHQTNIDKQNAQDEVNSILRASNDKVQARQITLQKEMAAEDERNAAAVKTAGSSKALIDAAAKKHKAEQDAIINRERSGIVGDLQADLANVEAKIRAGGPGATAAALAAKGIREKLDEAQGELNMAVSAKGPNQLVPGKTKHEATPRLESPIQIAIREAQERVAEYEAEIPSLINWTGKIDKAAGEVAKLRAKARLGGFNYKDPTDPDHKRVLKPSTGEVDELAGITHRAAALQDAAQEIAALTTKVDQLEPQYAHAMAVLMDPLGDHKEAATLSWDKTIAKLRAHGPELAQAAKEAGISVEEVMARAERGKKMAAAGDLATDFAKLNQELLKTSITAMSPFGTDRRDAQFADEGAAFERFATKMREEAIAAGRSLDPLNKQLDELWLNIKKTHEFEAMTPIQKLAGQWKESTQEMQADTAKWSQSTIDAFVNMAKTGKFEWASLVEEVLADLLKIQLQKSIGPAITSGFDWFGTLMGSIIGHADGGVFSSGGSVPLKRYAAGGIQRAGHPAIAMYGEGSSNEAFVPLPDGRSIPVSMKGGSSPPNIAIQVVNQSGVPMSATPQQGGAKFDGTQWVVGVVLDHMNKPGPFRDGMRTAVR
jgi:tape measure domain-containing protein